MQPNRVRLAFVVYDVVIDVDDRLLSFLGSLQAGDFLISKLI